MSGSMVGAGAPSSRQLSLLWFTVLSAPLMIAVAITLAVSMLDYQASKLLVSREILWGAALAGMAVMLLVGRFIRNFCMAPERLAERTLPGNTKPALATRALAAAKVQAGMFMALGLLNAVSTAIVGFCLIQADAELAWVNAVYTLVLAVIYKPDFVVSLRETETVLRRQG